MFTSDVSTAYQIGFATAVFADARQYYVSSDTDGQRSAARIRLSRSDRTDVSTACWHRRHRYPLQYRAAAVQPTSLSIIPSLRSSTSLLGAPWTSPPTAWCWPRARPRQWAMCCRSTSISCRRDPTASREPTTTSRVSSAGSSTFKVCSSAGRSIRGRSADSRSRSKISASNGRCRLSAPGGGTQWLDIAGATGTTFAPTDFHVGNPLRVQASFTDGLGVKETVFSAPTAILVTNPAVNHAPTVVTQVAEPGLFDTSAREDQPITLFLPLTTTFTDDTTAAANLIYTATLADGSPLAAMGLAFATTPDGAGGVSGGVITGTAPAASPAPSTSASRQPMRPVSASPTPSPSMSCRTSIMRRSSPRTAPARRRRSRSRKTPPRSQPWQRRTRMSGICWRSASSAARMRRSSRSTPPPARCRSKPHRVSRRRQTWAPTTSTNLIVQASDGTLVDTQALAVTVTNVNEAPVIITPAAVSTPENSTAVMTVNAKDPDAGAVLTYSIGANALVGGADVISSRSTQRPACSRSRRRRISRHPDRRPAAMSMT